MNLLDTIIDGTIQDRIQTIMYLLLVAPVMEELIFRMITIGQ